MFLLHVLLLLALTLHTPALLCNPQFPGSRHPSSCQELEKPLSGGQTSSPPTLPRCLPCPALRPPLLYKQMAWQPGRQGSYQRMGEARLQPAPGPCSPPIPRHVKAVPELGPLSLLREASIYPHPLPSKRTAVLRPGTVAQTTPSQRERWLGCWGFCLML